MSTVEPSPPCAMMLTPSFLPIDLSAGLDARGHGRGVLEERVDPRHAPRRFGVGRGRDLEAAGAVGDDGVGARRLDDEAGGQQLAAARAAAMAG